LRPEASVISPRPNERLRMISWRRAREADLDKILDPDRRIERFNCSQFTGGATQMPAIGAARQQQRGGDPRHP